MSTGIMSRFLRSSARRFGPNVTAGVGAVTFTSLVFLAGARGREAIAFVAACLTHAISSCENNLSTRSK